MNAHDLRTAFLSYFASKGHVVVPSSSLVPHADPTLLFSNAGMNQFKEYFLGTKKAPYSTAASAQKCVRAGGKHNDLEAVGFTTRHLTFFEMLGNFSFGDYFKQGAIEHAWHFLTKTVGLSPDRLYVSVFREDDEAYEIWNKIIGVDKSRIVRLDEKDNFWQMGDTGPCGPCTEIYYDVSPQGKADAHMIPLYEHRFIEIWNLVFMQYNKQQDGTLLSLDQKGVDTGMGFERMLMVLQGKDSVFHIDLFSSIYERIKDLTGVSYEKASKEQQTAFHVLADHVRSSSFIIADGVTPSNEGRGYVLRKIIRRALLFASKISSRSDLFGLLVESVAHSMGEFYSSLKEEHKRIEQEIFAETEQFFASLHQGKQLCDKFLAKVLSEGKKTLSGQDAFKLYDTYGFPLELTKVLTQEKNISVDEEEFIRCLEKQREISKPKHKQQFLSVPEGVSTQFVGYQATESATFISALIPEEDGVWIVTETSPLYVESGGQINDTASLIYKGNSYSIVDIKKIGDPYTHFSIAAKVKEKVSFEVGEAVTVVVDASLRADTAKNHTATHLLQAALKQVLGSHVQQAGSVVRPDLLRFDFTHSEPLSSKQIEQVERLVNEKIQENISLDITNSTLAQARAAGVIAFFGEKYNENNVRVVAVPGFSAELCGGTHVRSTGEIGLFKIVSDAALSAGVRRMVAVTGKEGVKLTQELFGAAKKVSEWLACPISHIDQAVELFLKKAEETTKSLKFLKKERLSTYAAQAAERFEMIGSVPFLFVYEPWFESSDLRELAQAISLKKQGACLLVAPKQEGNSFLFSFSAPHDVHLSSLIKEIEKEGIKCGGKGGILQGSIPKEKTEGIKKVILSWISLYV